MINLEFGVKINLDRGIKTKWKSRQNRGPKSPDTSSGVSSGSENSGPESPVTDWRLHNVDLKHISSKQDSTGGSDTNSSDDGIEREFGRNESGGKSSKNRIWRRSSVKTVSSTTTTTSISTEAEESVLYKFFLLYKFFGSAVSQ